LQPTHLRRKKLRENWYFDCNCARYKWLVHLLGEDVSSQEDASTSWPSSSGLRGRRRTSLTILDLAYHALFNKTENHFSPYPRLRKNLRKNCLTANNTLHVLNSEAIDNGTIGLHKNN
jgi:hypothetical protein